MNKKFARQPFVLLIAMSFLAAAPVTATPITTLDSIASTYNVFLTGNLGSAAQPYTSSSQGAMAVGGDAFLRSFSMANQNGAGVPGLTVGGNLTYQSGTIHGDVQVGGNASFPTNFGGTTVTGTVYTGTLGTAPTSVGHPTVTGSASSLDFQSIGADLMAASAYLAGEAARAQGTLGTDVINWGHQLVLTGTSSGINYFDVTTDQLALLGSGSLTINAPAGSTAIVNVSGTDARIGAPGNFGFFYNGIDDSDVLFNFYEATSLRTQSFTGTILAPLATVSFINGAFDGTLMAASLDSLTWQNGAFFRGGMFDGQLPVDLVASNPANDPVGGPTEVANLPEPGTFALLASSLLAVAFLRRRVFARI